MFDIIIPILDISVSSIGTNELQLVHIKNRFKAVTNFSFLYRNERTATGRCKYHTLHLRRYFSFLYRNERTATLWQRRYTFQITHISVSSIGTNELQRRALRGTGRTIPQISVSSIGTNELQLVGHCPALAEEPRISVSSIGTNELQLSMSRRNTLTRFVFQFPLSERTNCNSSSSASASVSASAFQFPLSERTNCNKRRRSVCVLFGYISVSSIGTNELQRLAKSASALSDNPFQFPLSERTNCNHPRPFHRAFLIMNFSFLYRNERTAT